MNSQADKTAQLVCHLDGCQQRGRYYVVAERLLYCPEHWTDRLFSEGCTLD